MSNEIAITFLGNDAQIVSGIYDRVNSIDAAIDAAPPLSAERVIYQRVSDLRSIADVKSPLDVTGKSLKSRTAGNVTKVADLRDKFKNLAQNLVAELDRIETAEPAAGPLVTKSRGIVLSSLEELGNSDPKDCLGPMAKIVSVVEKLSGKINTVGAAGALKEFRDEFKTFVKETRIALTNLVDKIAKTFSKIANDFKKLLKKGGVSISDRGIDEKDLLESLDSNEAQPSNADVARAKASFNSDKGDENSDS
ncbi:MAG: hypothetical protein LBB15_02155 [Puniceicoccales bacterium]|jgi:hypothetical protein|nr:hypothetical protein [Puniceicoccales bacterium]